MVRTAVVAAGVVAGLATGATAWAQAAEHRYVEDPTSGIALPTAPIAGEYDARTVSSNPAGLALLRGPELALALDVEDPDVATSAGQGFGAFFGQTLGGGWLPRLGMGMGVEWLRPPEAQLQPDPGQPFRFTLAYALALGRNAGVGVSWHHFIATGALDGVNAFDLGASARVGTHLAFGAALLDVATRDIAGTPVQRRYELEATVRPWQTDRLELAAGGRIGETRHEFDEWARIGLRAARGVYLLGQVESRDLTDLTDLPSGTTTTHGRDLRITAGLSLSLGSVGVTALASGLRDDTGSKHFLGSNTVIRASLVGAPSAFGRTDHLERVELGGEIGPRELTALVLRLRSIARDDSVRGLVVTFEGATAGWATMQELRDAIAAVRRAGKPVFAYMSWGTGRDYYVASVASKIYVDPAGGLRLVGASGTATYFRGAFDLIGVDPEFEKIAEYKSAPEQLTERGASEPAARMRGELFDDLYDRWTGAIADARHLAPEDVRALIEGGPYTAGELAADHRLVDAVASPEKLSQLVVAEMGAAYPVETPPHERPDRWDRPAIAVIYVDGDIIGGASKSIPVVGSKLVGAQTVIAAIAAARADARVGGIVLRIDSPGGDSVASELISREVFATRGIKPIVCSMADVAASGGYFVAAGCDRIYADAMTITGSIGIFTGKFDVSKLLAKLGVTVETYKHGEHADAEGMFRAFTPEERDKLQKLLRYMYGRFVAAVAAGRGLTPQQVDDAGRGHVYTGSQATAVKLVDKLGGLTAAIDDVRATLHLAADEPEEIIELPRVEAGLLGTLGVLLGQARASAGAAPAFSLTDLPVLRELLRAIPASVLLDPTALQARLPYQLDFD